MGQGTVDLPDPMDAQQPGAGNAAGVDDLLAQLAGDEIDRLLAETEKTESTDAIDTAVLPTPRISPPAEPPALSDAELEALSAAENADLEMKATLDALAEDLSPPKGDIEPPTVIAPDAVEKVLAEAAANDARRAIAEAAPAQVTSDVATSSAERAALAEPAPVPVHAAAVVDSDPEDASAPFWLVPLELLSAPLGTASPGVRDAIGKIAILTTFNAVAVLIYVMIFRRH